MAQQPKTWMLKYDLVDNFENKSEEVFDEHMKHAERWAKDGVLLLGGTLKEPADIAYVILKAPDQQTIEEFVHSDPFFKQGLVKTWDVREWQVIAGAKKEEMTFK